MVRFTASIYQSKRSEHVLDCVQYLTHETEKQQALGKHPYDDSEIKNEFWLSLRNCERRNALALRAELSERTDSRYSLIQEYDYSPKLSSKKSIAYQNDSEAISSV